MDVGHAVSLDVSRRSLSLILVEQGTEEQIGDGSMEIVRTNLDRTDFQ